MSLVVYGISFGVASLAGNIYANMLLMAVIELPGLPLTFWMMNSRIHTVLAFTIVILGMVIVVVVVVAVVVVVVVVVVAAAAVV
ncbi:solute carrier family 22 member 15 [Elysia marginata]|uniref:Solute carrier family 22 member 15 n=1 Tax=Elysia marginata TaxID=1093978 RepID=A0AAV4EYT4_9GAST|nr:solute carrier family 22 member 15 [Elysia marginata]